MRGQTAAEREEPQCATGFLGDRQRHSLPDRNAPHQAPVCGRHPLAGAAACAQRLHFRRIRLARHEHHLRGGQHFRRQARCAIRHHRVAVGLEVEQALCGGVVQEVVRLIDEDAVWQTGATTHDIERRQHRADVVDLRTLLHARQVDDDAAIGIAQGAQQLPRGWRRILPAEDGDPRQRLERSVVAFGIDDAHAVPVQNQLLAEQPCHPGLAGLRVAGDQHVAPPHGERELATVFRVPEHETTACLADDRNLLRCRDLPDVGRDGWCPSAGNGEVGGGLQGIAAPGHCGADLGESQHLVVVFGVADGQHVPRRQPQHVERRTQARRLAHALRQCHDPAAIEGEHERQFECPDGLQDANGLIGLRVHQAFAALKWNPTCRQPGAQRGRHKWRQQRGVAAFGEMHNGAVLRDNAIHEMKVAGHAAQFTQDASGDQQHDDAPGARIADGRADRRVETVAAGNGPVVVERQHG